MNPKLRDEKTLEALNLSIPSLPCKVCGYSFGKKQRVDCIGDNDQEESFCIQDWSRLVRQYS